MARQPPQKDPPQETRAKATPAAKPEPQSGVRKLRVRARLADGREFLSGSTFIVPGAKDS